MSKNLISQTSPVITGGKGVLVKTTPPLKDIKEDTSKLIKTRDENGIIGIPPFAIDANGDSVQILKPNIATAKPGKIVKKKNKKKVVKKRNKKR